MAPPRKKQKLSEPAVTDEEPTADISEQMTATARFFTLARSFAPELTESSPLFTRSAEQSLSSAFATGDAPTAPAAQTLVTATVTQTGGARPLRRPDQPIRYARAQIAMYNGGIVNPTQPVPGPGRYAWLMPYDREMASRMGITNASTITLMRSRGDPVFTSTHGPGADPSVVWYSDRAYLNPTRQPTMAGHWEFQTPDVQEWAATQVGGSEDLGMPARPSADDIWNLRQRLLTQRVFDITHDMALVYVPDVMPDVEGRLPDGTIKVPLGEEGNIFTYDPTNGDGPGGQNDQTGDCEYFYHDILHFEDGLTVVVDRATPRTGDPRPHLFRGYGLSGWADFPHIKGFDWSDESHISALVEWRYQILRRRFGPKRMEVRPDYSERDTLWLSAKYEEATKAGHPSHPVGGFEQLLKDFNAYSRGEDRGQKAVNSKWSRILLSFAKKGVVVVTKRQTLKEQMDEDGQVMSKEEQKRAKAREEVEGEEDTSKKRKSRKKPVKKALYQLVVRKEGKDSPVVVESEGNDEDDKDAQGKEK